MKMIKMLQNFPIPNMISWSLSCFHLLNNNNNINTIIPKNKNKNKIKNKNKNKNKNINLIHSDGRVTIYNQPIKVSDLILQFPKHQICRSDSFTIGRQIPQLSGNHHLKPGHNYFLLPSHFFNSVLSFLTVASFFSAGAALSSASRRPFDILRTPSGALRIRLTDDFISALLEQSNPSFETHKKQSKICTTPQLAKDYTQLASRRQWKPKLDTIRERKKKKSIRFVYKAKNRIRLRV